MRAVAIITECTVETSTPVGNVTVVSQFSTDDTPRTGIVVKNLAISLTEAQMQLAVKQAVADYINTRRASSVIQPADVRII